MKKRILIVSYFFPPSSSAEAIQTGRIVKKLGEKGYKIDIVTGNHEETNDSSAIGWNFPNHVNIYPTSKLNVFENKYFKRIVHSFPFNHLFSDGHWWWFPFAVKKCSQLLSMNKYDLIYTRSQPFTSNLVGLYIKTKFKLKWIAHFSDPWIDNPFSPFVPTVPNINTRFEKKVFEKSDSVTVPSFNMENFFKRKFPLVENKIVTIPHCFDEDIKKVVSVDSSKIENKKIRVVHAGMFYKKYRTPDLFIDALHHINNHIDHELINNLEIIFIGSARPESIDKINTYGLEKQFTYYNRVGYMKSLEYMKSADILLLIDTNFKESQKNLFFPSKLIDYIGMEKPIIGIGDKNSVSSFILEELHYPFIDISLDKETQFLKIYQALIEISRGNVIVSPERTSAYTGDLPVKMLEELFK